MLKSLLKPFASLKLTVILLALSMALVYAGTWAQVDTSIWQVQEKYFHSWFVYVSFQSLLPRSIRIPGGFPLPGGWTVGLALLVNLVAAHTVRFKFRLKRIGIILIHLGLILLLTGEGLTKGLASEGHMYIEEGGSSNFIVDTRSVELAIVDTGSSEVDAVTVIPGSRLRSNAVLHVGLHDGKVPLDIRVDRYYANSMPCGPREQGADALPRATIGPGVGALVEPVAPISGTDTEGGTDRPSALASVSCGGRTLGTMLLSTFYLVPDPATGGRKFEADDPRNALVNEFDVDGVVYQLILRFKRVYQRYTINLDHFSRDFYPGTDMPRNFESFVYLCDSDNGAVLKADIWMNHPLRYNGQTLYQSGVMQERVGDGDMVRVKGTILQVVTNPSWLMPYIACVTTGLGMLIHFTLALVPFLRRQAATRPLWMAHRGLDITWWWLIVSVILMSLAFWRRSAAPPAAEDKHKKKRGDGSYELKAESNLGGFIAVAAVIGVLVYMISVMLPPRQGKFNTEDFGSLPVSFQGRIQPLDSVARNTLRAMSGRESLDVDGGAKPAIEWLLDVFSQKDGADREKVFRIDHPQIKSLLGADEKENHFSFRDLRDHRTELANLLDIASRTKARNQDLFQEKLLELGDKYKQYVMVLESKTLFLLPPPDGSDRWLSSDQYATAPFIAGPVARAANHDLEVIEDAWRNQDTAAFNDAVADWRHEVQKTAPTIASRVDFEHFYDRVSPFIRCVIIYVVIFILAAFSWLGARRVLWQVTFGLLLVTFLVHTLAIMARIYISQRPPVTNLASSALFIGWGICGLCILFEAVFRNGLAVALAAVLGFTTLLIGHFLSLDGDNMKVLEAVLDTNLWLATHVVCVTLGYAATFLAGCLGIAYVVLGVFTEILCEDAKSAELTADQGGMAINHKTLARMIYGVACFAIFFSFVGTVVGGIWADQSWGRFWGWDAKENGAVLVVLANAILLHARWGGMVKERGIALLAIFGNIITSWSWFGTNMLGVGLHSYGFVRTAMYWLLAFVGTQILLIAVGLIPKRNWASFAEAN